MGGDAATHCGGLFNGFAVGMGGLGVCLVVFRDGQKPGGDANTGVRRAQGGKGEEGIRVGGGNLAARVS